jgi:hypothetical protein
MRGAVSRNDAITWARNYLAALREASSATAGGGTAGG